VTALTESEAAVGRFTFPDGPRGPWEYEGPDGVFITPQTMLGQRTGDLLVRPAGGPAQVVSAEVVSALMGAAAALGWGR